VRVRLAVAGIAVAIAGCGTAPTSASPLAYTPPPVVVPVSPGQSGSSGPVAIDPSLLDHLPAQVDGLDVMRSPEYDALAVADPAVVAYGEGIATAIVADPASEAFATVTIVRFRPGVLNDGRFRDWRDSFDLGVCERAGGVTGNAEASIGGRLTYIGTCGEGVHTYHVRLDDSRVLVSVSALGDRRLGELLVQQLRD
jgi:hypothetical protein